MNSKPFSFPQAISFLGFTLCFDSLSYCNSTLLQIIIFVLGAKVWLIDTGASQQFVYICFCFFPVIKLSCSFYWKANLDHDALTNVFIYRNGVSWAIFGPQQPLCFDFRPNSSHLVSSHHKIIFQKNLSLPKKWLLRNCNEIKILLKSAQVLFSVSEHYNPFSRVAESDNCPFFPSTELGNCLHRNNFLKIDQIMFSQKSQLGYELHIAIPIASSIHLVYK